MGVDRGREEEVVVGEVGANGGVNHDGPCWLSEGPGFYSEGNGEPLQDAEQGGHLL